MISPIPMPDFPVQIIRKLNHAGFEAYAVGGCVRDVLLGKMPLDWDITTSALPQEVCRVFSDCRVIETGIRHGTVTVVINRQAAEITTYRVDGGYADSRHPDNVTFTPSLIEDLKRRDFTVNAMVWHPDTGITDQVGGIDDLNNRVLRCVGDPDRRFTEDALRILRALRFSSVYDLTPEPATDAALRRCREGLKRVSAERIQSELFRLICGDHADRVLTDYPEVFAVILPEIGRKIDVKGSAFTESALRTAPPTLPCRLAILLGRCPDQAETVLRRLKADNETIATVTTLLQANTLPLSTDPIILTHALHNLGEKRLRLLLAVKQAESPEEADWEAINKALNRLLEGNPCYSTEQLQIGGKQLLALGFHGPAVGKGLNELLQQVMDGKISNDAAILQEVAATLPKE